MINFRTNKYYLLILLAAFIVGGCGNFSGNYDEIESSASSESTTTTDDTTTTDNTTTTTDTTAPTVFSITPADNSSYYPTFKTISIIFSESIDTSSISTNTSK